MKQTEPGKRFGTVLPDNLILGSILQLKEDNPGVPVVLVSKDINLRIKASICGVAAEDYENDRAIDDFNLLFTGVTRTAKPISGNNTKAICAPGPTKAAPITKSSAPRDDDWYLNQFLYMPGDDDVEMKVGKMEGDRVVLQIVDDFRAHPASGLGHQRTQSRTEFRLQCVDGSGNRFGHPARHRRYRQNLAGACCRSDANHGHPALSRNHHDPCHGFGR